MVSSRHIRLIAGVSVMFFWEPMPRQHCFCHRGRRPEGFPETSAQCLVPLLASAGLLLNAGTAPLAPQRFWMLAALSCTLWMIGQFQWTYYEIYLHQLLPDMFAGDIIFFLCGTPMLAALVLRPHLMRREIQLRFGYLDFILLLSWWIFLYAFVVLPWMYAEPNLGQYNWTFNLIEAVQSMIIVIGLGALWLRSRGPWRTIYANLFGASALRMFASLILDLKIDQKDYHTGSLYDLPLVASYLWLAASGLIAFEKRSTLDDYSDVPDSETPEHKKGRKPRRFPLGNGCGGFTAGVCHLHQPVLSRLRSVREFG